MGPLEEIAYLKLGDMMLELMQVKEPAPLPAAPWQAGCRMIALAVEDMDRAVDYLKSRGVKITWGPVAMGPGKRAEIKDPQGPSIELRQW